MTSPSALSVPKSSLPALQREVLAWYRRTRRDLPWRRSRDPYAIWVSEVMLQQTRVETVRPYYLRFLERFPTVEALAAAELDEVLAHWSGLGYYARARALHRAARVVVEDLGGALPRDPAGLAALPGFGPYTVAAVGSIALGLDLAAVDGNIARVLSRWLCREGDPREARALAELRRAAAELLPPGEAGDWNQALMELGATLCSPAAPACLACPAAFACGARREGRQEEIPPRHRAAPRPKLHLAAALVRRRGQVLLAQRPETGLFASLWELPAVEVGEGEDAGRRLVRWLGGALLVDEPLAVVEQTLTHRELRLSVFEVRLGAKALVPAPYVDSRFVSPRRGAPGGLSSVSTKALRQVGVLD